MQRSCLELKEERRRVEKQGRRAVASIKKRKEELKEQGCRAVADS